MKKVIILLFVISAFTVSALSACMPDTPVSGRREGTSKIDSSPIGDGDPSSFSGDKAQLNTPGDVLAVRVQRPAMIHAGKKVRANIRYELKEHLEILKSNEVINQIQKILWYLPRGYIATAENTNDVILSELPVAMDIEASRFNEEDFESFGIAYDEETQSDFTWIKLFYIPDNHAGMNVPSHGDIILYVEPENTTDAVIAIQDYDLPDQWHITVSHDWGQWLACEIDLFMHSTIAQ